MADIFDFKAFFNKKHPLKKYDLTDREIHVCTTCLSVLCLVNKNISPAYFNPDISLKKLLNNNRKKFEILFSTVIQELDLYSVIELEEIPKNREFESFPTFTDFVEYMMNKEKMKIDGLKK